MSATAYFPEEPYGGVTTFDAPDLPLAVVQVRDYPLAEMPALMDGTFPAIFIELANAGIEVCGPPLAWHSRMPTDTADFDLGVPVTAGFDADIVLESGRQVVSVTIPAGPVAATSYLGPYDRLGEAWGRFMGEVGDAGLPAKMNFFESYVSNPLETPDPSTLRTDLVVFLEK